MVNILISETNLFFQYGMKDLLADFFSRIGQQDICFHDSLSAKGVRAADVIVLSLCAGEYLTCFPELQERKKGFVIGLVEDLTQVNALPDCFQDVIFISRRATLAEFTAALTHAWQRGIVQSGSLMSCIDCQQNKLSPQQARIILGFYRGLSVAKIADELSVSDKTVFTHKYIIMNKFRLRSDYELVLLLNKVANAKRLALRASALNVYRAD
ncbi:LuxR C-terminal-related transcriptional regulator [Enterobacter wuhouensis]|uniref:helix-turn-helix transcriptional regulator n=1 Tax=Enterobacter wuhouensis TaxID=2529381 RepID=UPI002FD6068E